ncbi:CobW family GTP-binding protein [Paracoccus yeei]|uniref:CobW family GTP-binding protein n=1 Tax=Paracoccus yeei TaxID=147645 RepID=UPI0004900EB4|nr:CobW family GTP-binding protein [Paracoccus yeei]OWJ90367.1 cobalamin biosynthesis protein CobW [Paracoccus yeei]
MAAPLPVNLLCGYLGAGKTTLLNRLLDRQGERILVMVNDFGDIAVDAALIAGRSADTIQLSNGCICCSMGGGLFDAFERALSLRNRVDRLVIEASGVAEPRRLASFALAERELDCRAVVAVVDPQSLTERLADPRIGRVAESQIRGADAIFLSRADIVGRATLRRAGRLAARLNPLASQHVTPDSSFMRVLAAPHDGRSLAALAAEPDHGRLFASRTIRLASPPDLSEFVAIIDRHRRSIHRLKGYMRLLGLDGTHLLQLAGGELALDPAAPPDGMVADRLVAISPDADALMRLAADLESGRPA